MSRNVLLGPPPPDVRVRQTFELRTDNEIALRQQMPCNWYSWNFDFRAGAQVAARGDMPVSMVQDGGSRATGYVGRRDDTKQIVTNGEIQYLADQAQIDAHGLPWLTRVINGVLESRAIPTPDSFKDIALQGGDDFTVLAADEGARTITVRCKTYDVTEPSAGNVYLRGRKYFGFNRMRADELDGDADVFVTAYKRRTYPYGLCEVKAQGYADRIVKYDSAVHSIVGPDREIDRRLEGGEYVDYYVDDDTLASADPTTLTFTIQAGEIPNGEWPVAGDVIKQTGRMPWIAQLLTSFNTFSQQYMVIEVDAQYADDENQFGATWLWGNYTRHGGGDGFREVVVPKTASDGSEIDVQEVPGGGAGARGRYRRYHNIHAGAGTGEGLMADHAYTTGRPSVLPGVEWTEDAKQQHILINDVTDPNFVSYVDDFATVRVYWFAPGNPYGYPGNCAVWFVKCPDGVFRRIGGALCPPWKEDGSFAADLMKITNAVRGDFIRGNNLQFDQSGGSEFSTSEITNKFRSIKVWQFVDETAGGAGQPNELGDYDIGWSATPGDSTGGSGVGVVLDEDAITLTGGASGSAPVITLPRESITMAESYTDDASVIVDTGTGTLLTAGSSNPASVRVRTGESDKVTLNSFAPGTSIVTVYATAPGGNVSTREITVTVGGVVPNKPSFTVSTLPSGRVRLDIVEPDIVPDSYQVRVNGSLIATLTGETTQFDDPSTVAGLRQYAVRAITGTAESGDATRAIVADGDAPTGGGPAVPLDYIDVFGSATGGASGGAVDNARLELLEAQANSVRDQGLLVFETFAERNAWPLAESGLRATTLDGTWSIHDGTGWQSRARETVLSRVSGALIYGTPPYATEADKQVLHDHLSTAGVITYRALEAFEAAA